MADLLGGSLASFLGVGIGLFGLAAWATGQAIAESWSPLWPVFPAALGLTLAERFLDWGLFGGDPRSVGGFLLVLATMCVVAMSAWRATRARQMVRQYPWLFRREGVFGWRRRDPA
jgi:hypothetical protein